MEKENYHTFNRNEPEEGHNITLEPLTSHLQNNKEEIYLYRERFYVLALYSCCTFINAFGWITFSPITSLIIETYGVTPFTMSLV